jgi:hypothetical protein
MHEYDISLKLLLRSGGGELLRSLTGGVEVARWLDVELPELRAARVDLLGETAAGGLIHIELQSTNDAAMALRMLEYCTSVYRLFRRLPRQVLLYVGEAEMRMPRELTGECLWFRYEAVDIRTLDGDVLLESGSVGDNVIAVLARLRNERDAVRTILERIATLAPAQRDLAFAQLVTLAGLRKLEEFVEKEASKMPILTDIMDHKVLGREFKRGMQEGRLEGRLEGEALLLRRQIERRYGPIPAWANERISKCSLAEIEALADRIFDAPTLEDLLK